MIATLANRLQCTEGRVYTLLLGAVSGVFLLAITLPSVTAERGVLAAPTPAAAGNREVADAGVVESVAPDDFAGAEPVIGGRPAVPETPTATQFPDVPGPVAPPSAAVPTPGGPVSTTVPDDRADDTGTGPAQILASGWVTANAASPVATLGVPEGSLPVGQRLGSEDKRSYVRLGGGGLLELAEDPAGTFNTDAAFIRACPVASAAPPPDPGTPIEDAPAFDADACVDGTRGDDGTWTFDLAQRRRDAITDFAIVATPTNPAATFQVAFTATDRT